jgi:hypothetical protein
MTPALLRCALENFLRLAVFAGLLLAIHSRGAQPSPVTLPDFENVSWLPAMAPLLTKASAPEEGLGLTSESRGYQVADAVTLLVQAKEGKTVRQWAVVLLLNDVKPEEKKLRSRPMTFFINDGRELTFAPNPLLGMAIHVLGPVSTAKGGAHAKDVWSGSLINPDFLRIGLDRAIALLLRLTEETERNPLLKGHDYGFRIGEKPFAPAEIERSRPLFAELQLGEPEERAFCGMIPALLDFFQIASQTQGLREIMFEAIDIPWWALVKNGGRLNSVGFEIISPFKKIPGADWNLPADMQVYSFGMRVMLLGKPALNCRFAVTRPRVPLINTAGVLAIAAERPDGKGPRISVRVMAGRPAPAPTP